VRRGAPRAVPPPASRGAASRPAGERCCRRRRRRPPLRAPPAGGPGGPEFDIDTLDLLGDGEFVAATHTILWEVGELAPKGEEGSKGERIFRIRLRPDLPDGTVVANQAVVFFPSVPEETATNTVVNVIQPLVGVPQQLETSASQPVGITLGGSGASGGPLTFAVGDDVLNGELNGVAPNLTYAPDADFTGQDRFTFVVDDGLRRSRPAEVTIVVAPSDTDTTAPRVLWSWPESDAVLHEVSSEPVGSAGGTDVYAPSVRVGFSEAMDPNTITDASLTVVDGTGTAVPVAVRWDGTANEAELASLQRWADGTYTAAVDTAALDAAGNPLESQYAWRFRIDSGADACAGDCNGDGMVTVDELVRAVNIALGSAALDVCRASDGDADGSVGIDELVRAVNGALQGCPR
jgi:hypothetical protein